MASSEGEEAAGRQQPAIARHSSDRSEVAKTPEGSASAASSPGFGEDDSPPVDIPEDIDEESALKHLSATTRDQTDIERDVAHQASVALKEVEDNRDKNRITKAEATKLKLMNQRKTQYEKLKTVRDNPTLATKIRKEIDRIEAEIGLADKEVADTNARIEERHEAGSDDQTLDEASASQRPGETRRDFLLRTGKITPFARGGGSREGVVGALAHSLIDAEDKAVFQALEDQLGIDSNRSHQNLRRPGFVEDDNDSTAAAAAAAESEFGLRPRKKRRTRRAADSSDEFHPESAASPESLSPSDPDDYDMTDLTRVKPRKRPRTTKAVKNSDGKVDFSKIDDGDESAYQKRLSDWVTRRSRARRRRGEQDGSMVENENEEEWFKPSPDEPDFEFDNGLKLPGDIYPSLYDYQKTGVLWLAELYDRQIGGIVGDEMGLGKTIQVISFIAALHYSKKLTKPVIIVAPATVLQQWVTEFHTWWPALRVSILHSSGSGMLNIRNEQNDEDLDSNEKVQAKKYKPSKKSNKSAKEIVDRVVKHGHVLVTTYAGLETYGDLLIPEKWEYAVLDEGHKIRNPNTAMTLYCKELMTPNRIILSGTPMQNNLQELWSLFDFVNPMRLGTLEDFNRQFDIPIRLGGYANATSTAVMTAQKCAETLKDAISPYLLQRTKQDVATDLPKKSEQVLFCKLTSSQRNEYQAFLRSELMNAILTGRQQSLTGIDHLKKICNHPDLTLQHLRERENYRWGLPRRSGKMQMVKELVTVWRRFGHKILLFTQGVQMLDILENFVQDQQGIGYLRMDGGTPIKNRQKLVDRFNEDPDIHVFLLTTKVGGLGVNLTDASRVIIYDPDWNPATDIQARERAWRLGQKKEVTIYRLLTAGTIEEKIYQRQIFKQYLSSKVLQDPKKRTTLNLSDLHELFTLGTDHKDGTETSQLFKGSKVKTGHKMLPGVVNYDLGDHRGRIEAMVEGESDEEKKELQEINGIVGIEDYQSEKSKASAHGDEDRIMAGIFAKGVHEALEHEEIINGSSGKKVIRADPEMVRREAERVAAQAAQHLRRAAEQAERTPIGTVTWTGQAGEAGRPRASNVRGNRGGPGARGVLAGIRGRQGINGGGSPGSPRSGTPAPAVRKYTVKEFKEMIPPFMRAHENKVATQMIITHFNHYCTDADGEKVAANVAALKKALESVAKLETKKTLSTARGMWALKEEYQ